MTCWPIRRSVRHQALRKLADHSPAVRRPRARRRGRHRAGPVQQRRAARAFGPPKPGPHPAAADHHDAAAVAIRAGMEDAGEAELHLSIDARFGAQFFLRPASGGEIRSDPTASPSCSIRLRRRAPAASSSTGWRRPRAPACPSTNPNAPQPVQPLTVQVLRERLARHDITVIDVRPAADRASPPSPPPRCSTRTPCRAWRLPGQAAGLPVSPRQLQSQRRRAFPRPGFRQVFNVEEASTRGRARSIRRCRATRRARPAARNRRGSCILGAILPLGSWTLPP